MIYRDDGMVKIVNGDCRNMTEVPDASVHCIVSSPPYWGLRIYSGEQDLIWGGKQDCQHDWVDQETVKQGKAGSPKLASVRGSCDLSATTGFCSLCGAWRGGFGNEPSVEMYIDHSIEVLREMRRVLRPDAVLWLNIDDSYASGKGTCFNPGGGESSFDGIAVRKEAGAYPLDRGSVKSLKADGLKPKDLCLVPFRLAIAAQADGWWVRSVVIWNKLNPMPESVRDRPTGSHEYILMLTKSAKYYFDMDAVREKCVTEELCTTQNGEGSRNLRSVWTFATQPFAGAHFATFPEMLPETCIKASTPEQGVCAGCGAPWARVIEKSTGPAESWKGSRFDDGKQLEVHPDIGRRQKEGNAFASYKTEKREQARTATQYEAGTTAGRLALLRQQARENGGEYVNSTKTVGWMPTCKCGTEKRVPATVLDPFMGSGTTLSVASRLGRRAVGYDISLDYLPLADDRVGPPKMELI